MRVRIHGARACFKVMNMNVQEYKQLKAFARFDGLVLGLILCAAFFMTLASISNPVFELGALTAMLCGPFFLAFRLRYYRDMVLKARISFMRAFGYGLLCTFYGSLILAMACYVYFRFVDGGSFYQSMLQYLSMPEMKEVVKLYGIDQKVMKDSVSALAEARPIEMAFSLMYNVLAFGLFINLFIALVIRKNPRVSEAGNR